MERPRFLLEEMTWQDAKEALKTARLGLVPVGSLEQHGPHLCMAADAVQSYEFTKRLAEAVYPKAVMTAPIAFGVSAHHMAFAGTVTLRPDTLIALAEDVALSLSRHGVTHILFVNGHGGNQNALGVATERLRFQHQIKAAHCLWPALGWVEGMQAASSKRVGHSCELEVSMVMYLSPRHVKADRLTEGEFIDAPLRHAGPLTVAVPRAFDEITVNGAFEGAPKARPELGETIVNAALHRLAEFIEDFLRT
jgi:creatinine amidohydrolase